jgi:hypothetical protein
VRRAVAIAAVVASCALGLAACSDDPESIALYGDSLTVDAIPALEFMTVDNDQQLVGQWFDGTAPCDFIDDITQRLDDSPPEMVVLAFAGNNVTPCVGGLTGDALGDKYEADAEAVVAAAAEAEVPVVLVGPPAMADPSFEPRSAQVRERFAAVADRHDNVSFVDGREYLSPDGFSETLACLDGEDEAKGCIDGQIAVRNADGVHWDEPGPDGYSAGSYRWAQAILSNAD